MQTVRSPKVYDAVVVGSGAAGGMTALVLARAGAKVLMLEGGGWYDTAKESQMFAWPYQAPLRAAATDEKPFGYFDASVGAWQVAGEPYTNAPGTDFRWWRSRMLGGRTNHWGRISLRMGPYDFKPYKRDGLGLDWPFEYSEMEPWYDQTEALVGVYGDNRGMENTPDSLNGTLQPPPHPRAPEMLVR